MLMGRTDRSYSVEEVQHIYELIEGEAKQLIFFESSHRVPKEYIPVAINLIKKHL
jgi:esterase/lipase